MSDLAANRKITGLSAEKWTLHQLKALQPRMQLSITASTTNGLASVIDDLINLFSFRSSDSEISNRKVLKSLSAELLSDVIKTLTVHHCSLGSNANSLSYQLGEEIFECFSESHFDNSAETTAVDSEDNTGASRQSSSLGTLAGLGSIGFEDNATLLLDHLSTVLSTSSHETSTNSLIKFTVSYLQFLQAVMNFHGNRKKLFTNICEVLLPSVMRLLNHCNASSHAQGSLATLQTVLSEVIEKGLFDEKNVEELATLHLTASAPSASSNKNHPNKKQKGNNDHTEIVDAEGTEGAKKAKVDSVKNKSFHDTLFRTLESRYYASQSSEDVVAQANSYASGVACLFKIYCAKSASIALQASTQQPSTGFQARGSFNANARNDSLGMDAVNTRKHLIRVFHFLFLVIEAFHTSNENSVDSLLEELKGRASNRKPVAEPTATPGKKRKQEKHSEESAVWSSNMVRLLKARLLRNAVLAACVETVTQQAIPNHDSLYRYVELLVTLSTDSVKDCVKLQALVADSADTLNPDAEFAHSIVTADLECVRLVALIDHTTVVDHRLHSVVQVLGAPDLTGFSRNTNASSQAAWVEHHFTAKRDLFGVVLRVHGELRLLDQLVGQLTLLDKQQHTAGGTPAPTSMLHAIISSSQVSRNLVALFSAAPIGQLPQHWANLSGTVSESSAPQPANAQVGVVTCSLARALMEAQLHSVRSNISVFNADTSSDAVDANTVNMTVLLWRLTCTVQSLVTAQNTGKATAKESLLAPLVQNVLSTLSVLLRFVAHFHAGTIKQLTVPCLSITSSDAQLSFHGIGMGHLLNNLIALRLDDITFVPVVKTLLSLVLLNSNITAKARTAAAEFVAQTTILSKYTLDILPGTRSGASAELFEGTKLDLLHLVLCDIRIWTQFAQSESSSSSLSLKFKQLVPLFQTYIRAGVAPVPETSTRLARITSILTSAAVADNQFVREAAHSALQTEWLALDASTGKKTASQRDSTAARTALLASLRGLFGAEFLYSATFFMPSVLAHLIATRALSSRAGAAAASTVLLGHLRSAPSERYTSQISGYPAKTTALDVALYFLTGKVVATEVVDTKVLDAALTQVYDLARTVLEDEAHGEDDSSLTLVNLLIDVLLSRSVQQFNVEESSAATTVTVVTKAIAFIKEISIGRNRNFEAQPALLHTALSCFVSAPVRKIENSATKDVNPSDPLIVEALHQLVADLSQRLLQKSANKPADVQADSADLHSIGEAVVVISAMAQKSSQASLSETAQTEVIKAMFLHASTVLGSPTASKAASHTSGWLYLFGALSEQILLRFGVVTLPQITEAPTADMYLPITISLPQLELLCGVLQRMLTLELKFADTEMSTADSTALTMPVVSMLTNLLNAVLSSRICNCEPHQILSSLKSSLLLPLQRGDSTAQSFAPVLCRDVLIYFTEHGRKLLPGGKLPQEKFQQFHESLIELTVRTYQDIIAGHRGQTAEDVNQLAALLYHTNCVTATVSAVLQRQGRGGARRKNKENDTKSTLFRCDLWFDGLLSTVTLITSHMHMWQEAASANASVFSALACNASTVLLAKSLLQNVERLVAVSTSSSLPNLNTAIGAIVLTITSTVTLLLRIDNAVLALGHATHNTATVSAAEVTQSLQVNLNSCYHLICRVFSTVASSQVLEKHVHFIACAAVEGLSKASVSRAFQEVAYPGIYALFEKCQSRQKTQMFAMLDAQSRTLMTDLHNEFMRSFKFVGK